jgi:glycerophosphoryl diester phosphodiesterase
MVELDVRRAKDGEPVVYHGWNGNLRMDCGFDETIENLTNKELQGIHYRASDQHIPTLEEAFCQCASLNLGVMLDLKVPQELQAHAFFRRVGELLGKYHLTDAAVTISFHPLVREHLADKLVCRVTREDLEHVKAGQAVSLEGQFWFSAADELPPEMVKPLQERGAFVIPALNTFLYPTHAHHELAQKDALRFQQAGVEGFQLDSVYGGLFVEKTGC